MDGSELCVRPLTVRDASALIGMTAILEAELRLGQLDPDLERHLHDRLTRDGLLGPGHARNDLVAALSDLAQRIHVAIGSDDEPRDGRG